MKRTSGQTFKRISSRMKKVAFEQNLYDEIDDNCSNQDSCDSASSNYDQHKRAERAKIMRRKTLLHYDQQEIVFQ